MSTSYQHQAIVAVSQNGVIGKKGGLPWRLKEDLKWFKKITMGHTVLMGRKTWDSLPFPLPGRKNWVLSRSMKPTDEVRYLIPMKKWKMPLVIMNSYLSSGGAKFIPKLCQFAELFTSLRSRE